MRILLTSERVNSASFQFYAQSLANPDGWNGAQVHVAYDLSGVNFADFDVVLFMGYDPQPRRVRLVAPDILIGVLDPRPHQGNDFEGVDFLVLNGLEARDFFCRYGRATTIYETFPIMQPAAARDRGDDGRLVLGYHGNRIHLDASVPRISDAISAVAARHPLEFWAMYNIKQLGRWRAGDNLGFPVRHIQYDSANYAAEMGRVDIGLVPQFIPVKPGRLARWLLGTPHARFNEEADDFLHRFKVTTNAGRHYVFAQYEIPVVADMTPSTMAFVEHGIGGYAASSTAGWEAALESLASAPEKRVAMGRALRQAYEKRATPALQNGRLRTFLEDLLRRRAGRAGGRTA